MSNQEGQLTGDGIYDKLVNMLPSSDVSYPLFEGEKHVPLIVNGRPRVASYVGPATQIIKRLRRGDKPLTETDVVAQLHDINYSLAQNLDDVRSADIRMIEKLKQIEKNKGDSKINILLGKKGIETKVYLENKGLLDKNKFFDNNYGSLSEEDKQLLENKRNELIQKGYGISKQKLKTIQPLSNTEIEHLMKDVKTFKGVYPKDKLKLIPKFKDGSIVINMDDSTGQGTHWVAINIDSSKPYTEYYDSFGLSPPNEVVAFLNKYKKPIKYQDDQLQNDKSVLCGYYCCDYCTQRYRGIEPEVILKQFTNKPSLKNEQEAYVIG